MLLKNTTYSVTTAAAKAVSGVALLIVLARLLPKDAFGVFSYAFTVATILGFVVDFGYNIKLLKDLARPDADIPQGVARAVAVKLALGAATLLFVMVLSVWPSLTPLEWWTILLLFLGQWFMAVGNTFLSPFKCRDRFDVETTYTSLDSGLALIGCVILAVATRSIVLIAGMFACSKLLFLFLSRRRCRQVFGLQRATAAVIPAEVRAAWPYALHVFVANLYLNIDTVILKEYRPIEDVATYQAGMRLVIGAGILLTVANSVLTPRLAVLHDVVPAAFARAVRRGLLVVTLVGVVAVLVMSVFSETTAGILYGKRYAGLSAVLWILGIVLFLRCAGAVHGVLLTVSGKQHWRAAVVAGTLVALVIADLWAIPRFGMVGAAWVLLGAHAVADGVYVLFVRREFGRTFVWSHREAPVLASKRP